MAHRNMSTLLGVAAVASFQLAWQAVRKVLDSPGATTAPLLRPWEACGRRQRCVCVCCNSRWAVAVP